MDDVSLPQNLENYPLEIAWVQGSNSWARPIPQDLHRSDVRVIEDLGSIHGVGPWQVLEIDNTPVLRVVMHGWYPDGRYGFQVNGWEAAPRVAAVLKAVGVKYALGDASVGGIQSPLSPGKPLPPGSLVVPTGFRMEGVPPRPSYVPVHNEFFRVGEPFCASLRNCLLTTAANHFPVQKDGEVHPDREIRLYDAPKVRYVCTMWGRVESNDEIDVCRQLGDHVVGMSIGHEAHWMRALGIHYAVCNAVVNHAENGIPDGFIGNTPDAMSEYYRKIAVPLAMMFIDTLKSVIEKNSKGQLNDCRCAKFNLTGFTYPV